MAHCYLFMNKYAELLVVQSFTFRRLFWLVEELLGWFLSC